MKQEGITRTDGERGASALGVLALAALAVLTVAGLVVRTVNGPSTEERRSLVPSMSCSQLRDYYEGTVTAEVRSDPRQEMLDAQAVNDHVDALAGCPGSD